MQVTTEEYNKLKDAAFKYNQLKDTIHRINNDKSMAYKRVNRLERENCDLRAKVGKLEKENDSLKDRVDWFKRSHKRQFDYREKLYVDINAKNTQIKRLEDIITEISEAKDELQRMCNDRYHLVKKYQERCEWYSACLRKDRELIRQLREELEHKANFMCKPFLKEHEDMKKDFEYVLNGAVFYSPEYLYDYFDELRKKWFDK